MLELSDISIRIKSWSVHYWHRVLCAGALVLQTYGVDAATAGVTVTPIGYDPASHDPAIAWIDNEQLIFAGQKSNADPKKVSFATGKMYIWNDSTKAVREYADATTFCYANSWIRYGSGKTDETGNRIIHMGSLGKEEAVKVSLLPPATWRGSNIFSCKPYSLDDFVPPIPTTHQHLVLREGDGYLTLRPNDHKEYVAYPRNVTLYREKGMKPVKLSITWDETIGGWGTTYSDYRRAYVMPPRDLVPEKGRGNWPEAEPRVVYVLGASDGKVERVTIPATNIFRLPRPTKVGWIYGGGSVKVKSSAGLYLYDGKSPVMVEAGEISAIVVNPDGCKAAVAINSFPWDKGSTPTNLKIFNFCAGRK